MNSNNRGTIKFKVMIGLLIGLVVVIMGIGSLHLYDYTGRPANTRASIAIPATTPHCLKRT
jgi:hypothetical protein